MLSDPFISSWKSAHYLSVSIWLQGVDFLWVPTQPTLWSWDVAHAIQFEPHPAGRINYRHSTYNLGRSDLLHNSLVTTVCLVS